MPLAAFSIFMVVSSAVFFMRAPVVFVTDVYFSAVYGERYEKVRRLEASLRILNQIKIVRIMGETDNVSINMAITAASKKPSAVFFLSAYEEAALFYAKQIKESTDGFTKVYVILDRNGTPKTSSDVYYVAYDTDIDCYRAGQCAAILALDSEAPSIDESKPKSIILIHDSTVKLTAKDTFIEGLHDGGFNERVDFIGNYDNRNWDNAVAIVFYSSSASYIQAGADTPAIIFSWFTNLNYMPDNIKISVDDSPFYVIPLVLKRAAKKKLSEHSLIVLPSEFIIFDSRIKNKNTVKKLKEIVVYQGITP